MGTHFSLVIGGPFHRLLGRLGMLGPDALPTWRAAVALGIAAWLLPGACALLQWLLEPGYPGWRYFTDPTTVARFVIGVTIMLSTDRHAEECLSRILRQFHEARLLGPSAQGVFDARLAEADRLTSSAFAEALMLCLAIGFVFVGTELALLFERASWEGIARDGGIVMSWASQAVRWFSGPIGVFILLRWLWRLVVWTRLLYLISRMPLELAPLHPDRCAGLGFLAIFPGVFRGFVFAVSCVIASVLYKEAPLGVIGILSDQVTALQGTLVVWLGLVLVLFVSPLLVFHGPLFALRERELLNYGRLVNIRNLEFHRRWILGVEDVDVDESRRPSLQDLNAAVATVQGMRTVPIDSTALFHLFGAAAAPLVVLLAALMPVKELVQRLVGIAL